jgi:hypothetical protein
MRFLHNVIVLALVLTSANLWIIAKAAFPAKLCTIRPKISRNIPQKLHSHLWKIVLLSFLLPYSLFSWINFPTPGDGSVQRWVYQGDADNHDVLKCVTYISRQDDVTGVFLDVNVHSVGGYTLLRHDVPIQATTTTGVDAEYNMASRSHVTRKLGLGGHVSSSGRAGSASDVLPASKSRYFLASTTSNSGNTITLATSSRPSNVFLQQNIPYLFRHLIQHNEYNYWVWKRDANANSDFPLKQVFSSRSFKVFKRTGDHVMEQKLQSLIQRLRPNFDDPAFWNILQKEAKELYDFGLYELSSRRTLRVW